MPEPVVIIGPAPAPGGPVAASATSVPDKDSEQPAEPAVPAGPSRGRRIAAAAAGLLGQAVIRLGSALWGIMRGSPRHSLAAGASLLILGGIWYSQILPGKSKHQPPANLIGGKSAGSAGQGKNATGTSDPAKTPEAETATASDPVDKPAPAPSSLAAAGAAPTTDY